MKITHFYILLKLFSDLFLLVFCQYNNTTTLEIVNEKQSDVKYILMWTEMFLQHVHMAIIPQGQDFFVNNNCPVQNCFIVWSPAYFKNITDYDALVFHGPHSMGKYLHLPPARSYDQVYIFLNKEPPEMHVICEAEVFDNDFYNMTVTYRLDSDVLHRYIVVRNLQGDVIGPKKIMHWMDVKDMMPIDNHFKMKLMWKYKTAAWFVSNCNTHSKREIFVNDLQKELEKYNLRIDVYGRCGSQKCGETESASMDVNLFCWKMVQTEYYFYLAFENTIDEDYVTEKLLNPLKFYTVPIVYGGANYTRFMPDGIYLDAKKLGVKKLASEMNAIIKNRERYFSFFKWHNHYSYQLPNTDGLTDPFCGICAYLNDNKNTKRRQTYRQFLSWWWRGLDLRRQGLCEERRNKETKPTTTLSTEPKKYTSTHRTPDVNLLEFSEQNKPAQESLLEFHV